MGAEHQLNNGKNNSDPPYQGELRSRQTEAHEGETTGAITVGGSDAAGRVSRVVGCMGTTIGPRNWTGDRHEEAQVGK